jgi:anti-sigma factor RsiW
MNGADELLMQAALDGEIDGPGLAAFEQRLGREPELARAYAELQSLRGALRAMPALRASDAFRERMEKLGAPAKPAAPLPRLRAKLSAIAASLAALGIGIAAGWSLAPRENIDREILSAHLRGMISAHPVDVASSDQHTVKPWFAGKLAVAPVTPDLSSVGFALEGGRIDIVAGEAAPTLVYRAGKHVISVTRLPTAVSQPLMKARAQMDGHALVSWSVGGVGYVATSDATAAELEAFAAAFRAASAAAR